MTPQPFVPHRRANAPQVLPDVRHDFAEAWGENGFFRVILSRNRERRRYEPAGDAADLAAYQVRMSRLWWVTEPACDLVSHAAKTLPADATLSVKMIPDPVGIAFFERPMIGIDAAADEGMLTYDAIAWYVNGSGRALELQFYSWVDDPGVTPKSVWIFIGGTRWALGRRIDDAQLIGTTAAGRELESIIEDRSVVAALHLVSTQERLMDRSDAPMSRATARRAVRADEDPSPIRVLRLPRRVYPENDDMAHGSVEWSHRWVVSGHWRQQPYGPGRTLRRPTWIAPYVKGPDDKPLDVRETVRVVQ